MRPFYQSEVHWRDYEKAIFEALKNRFKTDKVQLDLSIPGRFSGIERQIDVGGSSSILGHTTLAIVDCKCYARRVDVKDVEAVIGMAADVRADFALIVTTKGYTEAAKNRATNEPNIRLHLDIITIDQATELGRYPALAIMYKGCVAAIVKAPSGWTVTSNIIDGRRVIPTDALAFLHSNEVDVHDAVGGRDFGWCYFDEQSDQNEDHLDQILKLQEEQTMKFDSQSKITTWMENRDFDEMESDCGYFWRRIDYVGAGYSDLTVFVQPTPGMLFWVCLLTPPSAVDLAIKRLRFIVSNLVFVHAPHADPSDSHEAWQFFKDGVSNYDEQPSEDLRDQSSSPKEK